MANRQRDIRLRFRVTASEQEAIHQKMDFLGMNNLESYLRKMSIHGYAIRHELSDIKEMVRLLRVTSNSLNQLTKRVHETGNVYAVDIEGLRENYEKLWDLAEETLQTLNRL